MGGIWCRDGVTPDTVEEPDIGLRFVTEAKGCFLLLEIRGVEVDNWGRDGVLKESVRSESKLDKVSSSVCVICGPLPEH